jgi:glycosyltransferase involved in cell wall biosynthesis
LSGLPQPLASVVTPVYNGAKYLEECIESVLRQTYENWEYVIVDNCSTDRTLEIARGYEQRDPRIRVVAADVFVDAIQNANRALREISPSSKYCKVLHADDWLFPDCLQQMIALAEQNPSVGIVSAYRQEMEKVSLTGLPRSIHVLSGHEICRSTLLGEPYPYLWGSPSSLLIRSDLVRENEPFYNVSNPFQDDQEACYEVLRANDFGFVHQVLTFTRRHEAAGISYFTRIGAELPGQINLLLSSSRRSI